jgi:hypothetical protein
VIGVIGVIGARRRRPGVGEDGNGSGMDERGVGVGVVKWVEWSGGFDGRGVTQSINNNRLAFLSSPLLPSCPFSSLRLCGLGEIGVGIGVDVDVGVGVGAGEGVVVSLAWRACAKVTY